VPCDELELRESERGRLGKGDVQDAVGQPVRDRAKAVQHVERDRTDRVRIEREAAELDERDPLLRGE
jgi:phosphate starvation-inducible protein PhoH